jgi:hypothetical protein
MKPTLVSQAHFALIALLACFAALWQARAANAATSTWDAPAAQIATQIAAILGPGQTQIELTNRSSISASNLPTIRTLIEETLRSHGIHSGSSESANTIRITLSENTRESLWVAEILEGNQHQVTMVHFEKLHTAPVTSISGITLERKLLWSSADLPSSSTSPILAAAEWNSSLILLTEDHISLFTHTAGGWTETLHQTINRPTDTSRPISREMRGELVLDAAAATAYLPGLRCTVALPSAGFQNTGIAACTASDDPWPLTSDPSPPQKAFYNAARNYFTGVLTPATGIDLPPFYAALPLPLSPAPALLLTGIDGKPRIATTSGLKPLTGARDWGSDFAFLTSSCGNTEILASNSGEAQLDSLRAYDLRGNEVTAVSEPLQFKGSIVALSSTSTLSSPGTILAIIRTSTQDYEPQYEVDRVSALCQ